jgi:chloramphenicol-sensitive protein RarD
MANAPTPIPAAPAPDSRLTGFLYGLGAFGFWGLTPIYFKAVGQVPALEVMAHRVGLIFIWAIQQNRLLEASLGYYINPLVNVFLGMLFLHERLNVRQIVAVTLAAIGVLNLMLAHGTFPWIALALAFSFGFYGLLRKKARVDVMLGLTVETILLTPFALAFLVLLGANGAFGRANMETDLLLAAAGIVTAVPLLCFLQATQRLALSTVGLMQYLAPTLNFLLAVLLYDEPFTLSHLITFVCIWIALAIYSGDAFLTHRAHRAIQSTDAGQ